MTTSTAPRHPAKFSRPILDVIRKILVPEALDVGHVKVFDPFAGVGGVHDLAEQTISTVGVELQPEWAAAHEDTIVGDALHLPADWTDRFDVMVTSPCYGNRMADSHAAKDACRAEGCTDGQVERLATPDKVDAGCELGVAFDPCPVCKGSGLSRRNTYAHALREAGAEVADGSAAVLQWGPRYREFHEAAWREAARCLRPGGLAVLNVSNHVRGDREQRVVEFHLNTWLLLGCTLQEARRVRTQRNRQGANGGARVEGEMVLAMRCPT